MVTGVSLMSVTMYVELYDDHWNVEVFYEFLLHTRSHRVAPEVLYYFDIFLIIVIASVSEQISIVKKPI